MTYLLIWALAWAALGAAYGASERKKNQQDTTHHTGEPT